MESSKYNSAVRKRDLPKKRDKPEVSEGTWRIASVLILIVAASFRFYDLALVPLHHDEGVNGSFLLRLIRENFYHYDPANYHGPSLYYFALLLTTLLGVTTFAIRTVPVLFGIGTIWLVLCLRRPLGNLGSLSAAALIAVSPGAVYLSRYFIHESLFVFFTVGIIYAALQYYESANAVYLFLAASSCALLFATKETAMISAGVLTIALIATLVYGLMGAFSSSLSRANKTSKGFSRTWADWQEELERFGGAKRIISLALAAIVVFVSLNVLFYSSFGTNWHGIIDALKTFDIWTKTGQKEHVHEWWTYLLWLKQEEAPILLLGGFGALVSVIRADNRFAVFSGLWAVGILAAYSFIPYKTPWLALNFIIPLAILSGYAINTIYIWTRKGSHALLLSVGILVPAIAVCAYQMVSLNFVHYDDDSYAYVYAHTRREFLAMVEKINGVARRFPGGAGDMGITIVSPDYWPLPWYLRDFKNAGYFGRITPSSEPVIIGSELQDNDLSKTFGERYDRVSSSFNSKGTYTLRPGVELVLYLRRDIATSAP